jgi:rod shape-determining protein MreD
MSRPRTDASLVALSIGLALLLSAIPLPGAIAFFKPFWIALILIYWAIEAPDYLGLGFAFLLGLALDVLSGTLLGEHALRLVFVVYIVGRFQRRLRFYPIWQQALFVLVLLLNDRLVSLWIASLSGHPLPDYRYWLSPILSTALWPWLNLLLARVRRRKQAKLA